MCRVRRCLTNPRTLRLAVSCLVAVGAIACIRWSEAAERRARDNGKGTLVVTSTDWSYVVEVFSDKPASHEEQVSAVRQLCRDVRGRFTAPRETFTCWGGHGKSGFPHLVTNVMIAEGETWRIRLQPGTYLVAVHAKSPCGYYGRTISETIQVQPDGQVDYVIPER
jgi:hypothetical protein